MKKLLLVFAFSIFSVTLFSQQNHYAITFTPAFIPQATLAIQPGFEFRINKKFSVLSELAIPVASFPKDDIDKISIFRISSELKLHPEHAIEGRYFALQLGYCYRKFSNLDSGIYNYYAAKATGYSSAEVHSPVFFSNLKLGREVFRSRKVYLDYFIALGIRFIPTRYDTEGEYFIVYGAYDRPRRPDAMPQLPNAWEENKNYLRLGGGVGLKLGFNL